jgi:hypothetical protein
MLAREIKMLSMSECTLNVHDNCSSDILEIKWIFSNLSQVGYLTPGNILHVNVP